MKNILYKTDRKTDKNNKNIESNLSGRAVSNYLTFTEKKALAELKEKIKEKYPDAEIILYGSKARGDCDENSDIDLMIIIKDNYQINKGISFEELEKLFYIFKGGF